MHEGALLLSPGAGATAIPVNRWVCLEWEFDATTGGKSTRLFLDGKHLPLRAYNPERWPRITLKDFFSDQQVGCSRRDTVTRRTAVASGVMPRPTVTTRSPRGCL